MERILDLYCALLKFVIALCLAVMVVLVFGNVVLRYGFNSGITVSEELERMRKAAQPVVDKISAALKPDTVKLFNAELDRVRKEVK